MATDGYEKIDLSDPEDNLPPPPVRLEPEPPSPIPLPPPPPPPGTSNEDLHLNSTTEVTPSKSPAHSAVIKGTQLVKVRFVEILSSKML